MADKALRSPICTVLGHVDHGKSSILDTIRGTAIVASEAGAITQAIGASIIPLDTIKKICGALFQQLKITVTLPGLLFIDTPGHAAFSSLRKRGGNLADIAILVVDINEGFKPQTIEAIGILKQSKTPFLIAANKIDLIPGYHSYPGEFILSSISKQRPDVNQKIETKMYEIVGQIYQHFQLEAERFDRVDDYTKKVAIIPCSAKTGEGINALIMVLVGLAQRYLEQNLIVNATGKAKGSILEIKEVKGFGTSIDAIIYDGILRKGDTIVIGHPGEPITTKIKALLEPEPLAEMRDKKSSFKQVPQVVAATGVKIIAPDIETVIPGMPFCATDPKEVDQAKELLKREVDDILIETDNQGIIIKADTLGSLEALIFLLREAKIPIRKASIGDITKKDIVDAESNIERDPLQAVILGFNINNHNDSGSVKIIIHDVIYKLIEDLQTWKASEMKKQEEKEIDILVRPGKIELMKGYVFRQNNPAVCGCHIVAGCVKAGVHIMKDGANISQVKSMQKEKESVNLAHRGEELAIAFESITIGRQVQEGDILYVAIPEDHFKKLKNLKRLLKPDEVECMKEVAQIMRQQNPVWGI